MSVLTLLFNGDAFNGPPIADIAVDGVATPSVPVTAPRGAPSQAVHLTLSPGPHTVSVSFNNDAYGGPGKDRNLVLSGATLDGSDAHLPAFAFGKNGTYSFLVLAAAPAPAAPDVPALLSTMKADLDAQLGAILTTVKAGGGGGAPAPAANPLDLHAIVLSPEGTTALQEGTYTGALHVPLPQVITGKGMRKTVLDGQGGVGSGHRLAWGKGVLHVGADKVLLQDLGIINGGGADGTSDGEAGIYLEGFDGAAHLLRVALDGCENGVFMPTGAAIDLLLECCVFGRDTMNGLDDGRSHNLYVGGRTVTIRKSILLKSKANTLKVRGPALLLEDTFVTREHGRFIDCPGGTKVVSNRNTYVTNPGADSGNAFGFFDEGDANAAPGSDGSFVSTDDTFYFSRWNEVLWINNPNCRVQFVDPTVKWIGPPGATPPSVTVQGPGVITGPNPFVFTEANRVDAAPPVPDDPVA